MGLTHGQEALVASDSGSEPQNFLHSAQMKAFLYLAGNVEREEKA